MTSSRSSDSVRTKDDPDIESDGDDDDDDRRRGLRDDGKRKVKLDDDCRLKHSTEGTTSTFKDDSSKESATVDRSLRPDRSDGRPLHGKKTVSGTTCLVDQQDLVSICPKLGDNCDDNNSSCDDRHASIEQRAGSNCGPGILGEYPSHGLLSLPSPAGDIYLRTQFILNTVRNMKRSANLKK